MKTNPPEDFHREGPQPLVPETPPEPKYPVEALGPLAAAVTEAHKATGAPIALAAQSALSVAALAVQGHADVETLGGISPTSLYALTIAKSGERKSTVDGLFMRAMKDFEREKAREYPAKERASLL